MIFILVRDAARQDVTAVSHRSMSPQDINARCRSKMLQQNVTAGNYIKAASHSNQSQQAATTGY